MIRIPLPALWTDKSWRPALIIALVTALSGLLLVGVSGWFLSSVALAGAAAGVGATAGAAAFAYNYHLPAGLIRLFAITRTAGKYAERLAGHAAALRDQMKHRTRLFRDMASARTVYEDGWQLSRDDQLGAFIDDVEKVEFATLRASLPAMTGMVLVAVCLVATAITAPLALPFTLLLLVVVAFYSRHMAEKAAQQCHDAQQVEADWSRTLGRQINALVPLAGNGDRKAALAGSFALIEQSTHSRSEQARLLAGVETATGLAAPMLMMLTIGIAWQTGMTGETLLPAIFAGFLWLAAGEAVSGLPRLLLARAQARYAEQSLESWQGAEEYARDSTTPLRLTVEQRDVYSPIGTKLCTVSGFTAERGRAVAITGPSGCGKTSLIKEIAGWTDWRGKTPAPLGARRIVARSICHLSLHDAAIMAASVRDNLFSSADDTSLWQALETVELADRIRQNGGLDSALEQDSLSLGEARRISLARAILSREPVVLLDEPGEHLDAAQAKRLMQKLLVECRNRIVVYVTHDERLAALAQEQVHMGF
ncbi:ATP-binding cassette domain-containing protein [Aquisalinus flavus]|uniref:ABC transporter ATP-binding protein n=1 Tax=Aquisalinus flavus TaxID=1526572 RepID=A0A8J2V4S7_9PROT|nr:ATP-binding cassette domain-containing protein [Aquisalinus flavus]MBD0425886.1 ATP-binding cassette domain-containing protein [Aquisalinus flavus]UNE48518.1 ATP-binding cassette domain-containing protein [Aquisalinus flavus]GGD12469.1 ABC transporter ATP-binding protein [Aquisalinus flavus]